MKTAANSWVSTERRVILAFAATVLAGVALVALSLRQTLQRVLLERAETHLESRARVLASQCESELLAAQRDLAFLAELPAFRQLPHADRIDRTLHGVPEDVDTEKRRLLAALMGRTAGFSVLYVLQPNGDLYLVHPFPVQLALDRASLAERPYYREAVRTKAPVISDSFVGADGILAVAMLVPVFNDTGDVTAYLGGAFYLTHLSQLVSAPKVRPFDAGFILDRDGQLAAHTDIGLLQPGARERFSSASPGAGLHSDVHAHEADPKAGDHLHLPEWVDPADGRRYMAELVHLGMDWHLGLLRDRAAVVAEAGSAIRETTVIVSTLLLLVSGIGIWVAHRIGRRWDAAEHALAESEETARSLLNASPDPSLLLDTQGTILGLNDGAVEAVGQPRERLLGVPVFDFFPPDLAASRKARIDEAIRTGKAVRFEDEMGDRAYDNGVYPVTNNAGEVRQVAVLARDISERRAARQALHASEQRFRSTFEQAAVGIAHVAPDGSWQRVNQKLCDIVGYTRDELMRLTFQDITHPDDLDTDLAYVEQMLAGEIRTYSMEKRYIRKDSSEVWINLTVALVRHGDGEPAFFISVVEDISARKHAEAVLQERVKELNCLHSLGRVVEEEDGAIDKVLQASVSVLPPAWRFPDDATARIVWGDRTFQSGGDLGDATARLSASLVVEGGEVGTVEVAYRQDHPAADEGPFLHQERALLDTFAGRLGQTLERLGTREELRKHRDHLEGLVQERTEQLHRQKAVLEAINEVFVEALACDTEEQLGQTCLAVAEKLSGSNFGFIGEVNAEGTFDTIALSNPGWDACKMPHSDALVSIRGMVVRGIWGRTIASGHSEIVNEPLAHPDRVGTPKGHPALECFLGVPLMRAGKAVGMIALANKDGGYTQADQDAVEVLSVAFYEALLRKRMEIEVKQQSLLRSGLAELSETLRGDQSIERLCRSIITQTCNWLKVPTGIIHVADDAGTLRWAAGHAHQPIDGHLPVYRPGEGLVGQAALEKKDLILGEVPEGYLSVSSGLGQALPRQIHIKPIVHDDHVCAVIELGTLQQFAPYQSDYLGRAGEIMAYAIESAKARAKQAELLEETQRQAEELQAQQEELKTSNEELEEQTQRLTQSEERLKAQQEELRVTNEELEEKNELLARQKREAETARKAIAEKAEEVALASKYKSEFLANMSHELRTPLNSLLLLAQSLAANKDGNLTDDQVESATVIHGSGNDLLSLINEILDLARIEAGRMDLHVDVVPVAELAADVGSAFRHMAEEKGLGFEVNVAASSPEHVSTDRKRVEQVVKNLVSNALKFTETGGVSVTFGPASLGADAPSLAASGRVIGNVPSEEPTMRAPRANDAGHSRPMTQPQAANDLGHSDFLQIAVSDTGIGIAPEQQKRIFEAFQQADGTTSRKYGGSGLGLSISRELARLLSGEIRLESEPGKGSTFTLYLPLNADPGPPGGPMSSAAAPRGGPMSPAAAPRGGPMSSAAAPQSALANRQPAIPDDRDAIAASDTVILVIEDDPKFAGILLDTCHERGFKCLAAPTGEAGLELAGTHVPNGIVLDLRLPGIDGWEVLAALKDDTRTRHIPVHVISAEEASSESLRKGAIGHATKPLDREQLDQAFGKIEEIAAKKTKRLLLVEDNTEIRRSVRELIGNGDVTVDEAESGEQALEALRAGGYDCVILDLGLPDMDGDELLKRLATEGVDLPPVIVHTARELTEREEVDLREHAESIVIKNVRSQERLLDEVSLFLHRMVNKMPETKKQMIRALHETDVLLKDKKVLVVDDDMRTTFAVSRLLAEHGMKPLKAGNGQQALDALAQDPAVDLVLMDIMMPVMDGYETMQRIRAQERFRQLPIIALTAKAMPQDRQECIEAGASDYMPKPIDEQRLISMMRVWLYR